MTETKIAVVTGSNKGIGFGIVKNLCSQFNGVVYLTARHVDLGRQAVNELNKEGLFPEFHQLDVTDQESIETFSSFIKNKHGGLDVLVNNAGIAFKLAATEPFGYQAEVTLKTNYFGLKMVCDALFPLLRPHARVVMVSSSCGHLHQIPSHELREKLSDPDLTVEDLSDLMNQFIAAARGGTHLAEGWPNSAYMVSKVGASALSRIYHKMFLSDPREDIVINHVHPGYVNTDMSSYKGRLTVEQGADAPTYLALLPEYCDSPKGDYVWYTRAIIDWVNGPMP